MSDSSPILLWSGDSAANGSIAELLNRGATSAAARKAAVQFASEVLRDVRERGSELAQHEGTFEKANVRPEKSGLPFIVYISEKGNSRHDVRVKVAKGARANEFTASVSIRPTIEVVAGGLSGQELSLLAKWIELNRDIIIGYWDREIIYTEDVLALLKPVKVR